MIGLRFSQSQTLPWTGAAQGIQSVCLVALLLAITLTSSVACAGPSSAPPRAEAVGQPLGVLRGPDVRTGALRSFDELTGKVVFIDFWASWCQPCRDSLPFYEALRADKDSPWFVVIGVSVDETRELAERFLTEVPVSFPMIWDEGHALSQRFHVDTMPTGLLVGPDGNVRSVWRGFHPDDIGPLVGAIDALMAGTPLNGEEDAAARSDASSAR